MPVKRKEMLSVQSVASTLHLRICEAFMKSGTVLAMACFYQNLMLQVPNTIQRVTLLDIEQTYIAHSCTGKQEAWTFAVSRHYQDIWPPERGKITGLVAAHIMNAQVSCVFFIDLQ